MKSMSKWLVVLALVALAVNAFAIPANPRPRTLTQPDGSTFTAVLKGDEHFAFAEDADGFSIILDKNGWWTYAKQENGLLVPTQFKAGQSQCPYAPRLRPSAEAVAKLPKNANLMINVSDETREKWSKDMLYGVGGTKEKPSKAASGRQYVNVLLGDFTDSTFVWYSGTEKAGNNPYGIFPYDRSASNNHLLANTKWFNFLVIGDSISPYVPDSSAVGSMSNYYLSFTYGKCWWYGTIDGPRSSGQTRAASVANQAPSSAYYSAVLSAADPYVNYDANGDGAADGLMIVHPGPGQEESGDPLDIWSMSMTGSFGSYDGVTIGKLIMVPQNGQLGVFAHEMFHQIGGPDLYDYGYSGTPWGEWSLMDNGSWNGIEGGDQPAFPGGHLVYDVNGRIDTGVDGWLTIGNCDSISSAYRGDGTYTVAALDSAGEARRGSPTSGIRLWRIRNMAFRDSAQVFFVELRSRTPPYEIGLPEDGILITHIDTRMGGGSRFNDGPPSVKYYYSWVEQPGINPNLAYAAGDSNFPRQLTNAAYSAEDVSAGGYIENAIDSLSIPNCKTNRGTGNGNGNGPWIYDISKEGATMTFKVARTGLAAAAPVVGYVSHIIKDPIVANTANNNNGLADPWESDSLKISFRNTGAAITAGARCSLSAYGNSAQYVQIFDPNTSDGLNAGWQAVNGGVLAANAEGLALPFKIEISKSIPKFTDLNFSVKFTSTTPGYTTTSDFVVRVGGFDVEKVYDFQNLQVGGTNYFWRIRPCDLAIYGDTLWVANANLDGAAWQTRIYRVKKTTPNNPLVGGIGGDTLGSLNNKVTINNANMYLGGIDMDNSGNMWWTIQDSIWRSNDRGRTKAASFMAPNVSWGGTPMKRVRGIGIGPLAVDTVGPDCFPGDSLMLYWQSYYDAAAAGSGAESLYVVNKAASGTGVRTKAYAFNDQAWGAQAYPGNGYSWWNGRAADYDGGNVWTSSVWQNLLIRRNVTAAGTEATILETMPGPSSYGSYGTYGMALESTDSMGVPYRPAGTANYVMGARGTKHYMYCASMDEGKIYKVNITSWMLPTPPDSVKVTDTGNDNRIDWWKANDNVQKVSQYIIYRQAPGTTTPPSPANELVRVQNVYGGPTTHTYTDVGAGAKGGKAAYVYSVKTVNFYGEGSWGASVNASPLAVEVNSFTSISSGSSVTLEWSWASAYRNYQWKITRSTDGQNYETRAILPAGGSNNTSGRMSYTDQVEGEGIYYYQLYDIDESGKEELSGSLIETVGRMPLNYELSQNYPNPMFRGATKIAFGLKNPGKVSLVVYNVLGEQVKTLANDTRKAGFYTVHWDGTDDGGRQVSNGIYFYKLISGEFQSTKKLTVLK
jgi:M6 family metalloprotease-like protein